MVVPLKKTKNRIAAATAAKSLQSCPTLCDPVDGSPPGSFVPAILQATVLEWVLVFYENSLKLSLSLLSVGVWVFIGFIV